MDMTVVTVVHGGDTLTYTNLTQAQKQKLVGEIVQQSAVPNIQIPVPASGAMHKKQEMPLNLRGITSIAFTFVP